MVIPCTTISETKRHLSNEKNIKLIIFKVNKFKWLNGLIFYDYLYRTINRVALPASDDATLFIDGSVDCLRQPIKSHSSNAKCCFPNLKLTFTQALVEVSNALIYLYTSVVDGRRNLVWMHFSSSCDYREDIWNKIKLFLFIRLLQCWRCFKA